MLIDAATDAAFSPFYYAADYIEFLLHCSRYGDTADVC